MITEVIMAQWGAYADLGALKTLGSSAQHACADACAKYDSTELT